MDILIIITVISLIFSILGFTSFSKKSGQIFIVIAAILFSSISIYCEYANPDDKFQSIYYISISVYSLLLAATTIIRYIRLHKQNSKIKLFEVEYDDAYIKEFLNFFKKDIYNFFPLYQSNSSDCCLLILKDMDLAGILIGNIEKDVMTIKVDYIKREYRDLSIGNYFYNTNPAYFKRLNISKLITASYHRGHTKYLKKMGFRQEIINGNLLYTKNI